MSISHTKNQRANSQPGGLYNLEVAQLKRLYADTHCHVFQNDMHNAHCTHSHSMLKESLANQYKQDLYSRAAILKNRSSSRGA